MNVTSTAPRIDIRSLQSGRHRFDFALRAADLDLDEGVFRDLAAVATVDLGREVLVTVSASAIARLECSRTLEEFDQPLRGELRLLAVRESGETELEDGEVAPDDEADVVVVEDGVIDLTSPIRDIILLAVPIRPVAPQAANLEIPTTFGASDDSVDPRWAALRRLRSDGPEDPKDN